MKKAVSVSTYYLRGDLTKLAGFETLKYIHEKDRGVCVSETPPSRKLIVKKVEGDHFDTTWRAWLDRTYLDDLHDEYVAQAPVPAKTQQAAVKKLHEAKLALVYANEAVKEAQRKIYLAVEDIVRTNGRSPITIEGIVYDFAIGPKGSVYLIPRVSAKRIEPEKAS